MTVAQLEGRINALFHNRTQVEVNWKARRLLSRGNKFIPSPPTNTLQLILPKSFEEGRQRAECALRLKLHFSPGFMAASAVGIDTATFLDLSIYASNGSLCTALFVKPSNLGLYIPPFSIHPPHVAKAWIRAEAKRFCLNCDSEKVFLIARKRFYCWLRARGYGAAFLRERLTFNFHQKRSELLRSLPRVGEDEHFHRFKLLTQPRPWEETEKVFFPMSYHPAMLPFSPAHFARGAIGTTMNAIRFRYYRENIYPRFEPGILTAWRSLPSLGSLAFRAWTQKAQSRRSPPNPNPRGEASLALNEEAEEPEVGGEGGGV
jgi:hypothetical protein